MTTSECLRRKPSIAMWFLPSLDLVTALWYFGYCSFSSLSTWRVLALVFVYYAIYLFVCLFRSYSVHGLYLCSLQLSL